MAEEGDRGMCDTCKMVVNCVGGATGCNCSSEHLHVGDGDGQVDR